MARAVTEETICTAENVFREYLRQRRLKYTGERGLVLHAVMRNDEHFEAEQLLLEAWDGARLASGHGYTAPERGAVEQLIEFYEAAGKPEKVNEWRAKLPAAP